MDASVMDKFNQLTCNYCNNICTSPHSLDCGHVFCLSPCILSLKRDGKNIRCSYCGFDTSVDFMKTERKLAQEIRNFKCDNESIEFLSSCTNCKRNNCNNCVLCKHCDRYLCRECASSHKAMYSSVLFSRLLDLKLKYNHYANRRVELRYGHSGEFIERLQQTVEGALLRAEICLESLEMLLYDGSLDTFTDIKNLFTSSEQKCDLSKSLSKPASEVTNEYPNGSLNLPLNMQSFVKKYQKSPMQSMEDLPSTSRSFHASASASSTTSSSQSRKFHEYSTSEISTMESVAASTEFKKRTGQGMLYFQAQYRKSKVVLPTLDDIEEYFRQFGRVAGVIMHTTTPCGYIVFDNINSTKNALSLSEHSVMGCKFPIKEAFSISPNFINGSILKNYA